MAAETQFVQDLFERKYKSRSTHLCKTKLSSFLQQLLGLIFPQQAHDPIRSVEDLQAAFEKNKLQLSLCLDCIRDQSQFSEDQVQMLIQKFYHALPVIEAQLNDDADYIYSDDPAAKSLDEVILCYPGFYAIMVYRVAHYFHEARVPLFPRALSELAHEKTGVDIHPGARIGSPFFIDHGTGIVIGETTVIGKRVKLFQGVTLGAISVHAAQKGIKRHPDIQDDVLIYSNATILGGDTVVGAGSVIGANACVTKSVPQSARIVSPL